MNRLWNNLIGKEVSKVEIKDLESKDLAQLTTKRTDLENAMTTKRGNTDKIHLTLTEESE